jgi:hypothetical protein
MAGDVTPYLNLITSEHRDKPKYIAIMTAFLQPMADGLSVADMLVTLFDVDAADGVQLDAIGLWVGRSRNLTVPITGVYFTFDTGPGFDQGIFKGPFDPSSGLVALPDAQYRTLLKATIAANHWDGTIESAYAAYDIVFGPLGFQIFIVDNQDMSMDLILAGGVPDALTLALFTGGYLSLKPSGVRIAEYVTPGVPGPIFMFDAPVDLPFRAGFDQGAFANITEGP